MTETQVPTTIPWQRFNAAFVTRHSMHDEKIHDLYRMNLRILNQIPYPAICVQNPPALDYLVHCVDAYKDKYDWIINVDDDAFLCNFQALYDLMVYMEENQYDICGMADGLTYTPRDVFNPTSMNPFFNVIQLKTLKPKLPNGVHDMLAQYSPGLLKHVDLSIYHPEMWGKTAEQMQGNEYPIGYEPYYYFFYAILPKAKLLWLYGRSYNFDENVPRHEVIIPDEPRRSQKWYQHKKGILYDDDPWTTVLYSYDKTTPFILHTWYARNYGGTHDPTMPIINNVKRIDRVYEKACEMLDMPSR